MRSLVFLTFNIVIRFDITHCHKVCSVTLRYFSLGGIEHQSVMSLLYSSFTPVLCKRCYETMIIDSVSGKYMCSRGRENALHTICIDTKNMQKRESTVYFYCPENDFRKVKFHLTKEEPYE